MQNQFVKKETLKQYISEDRLSEVVKILLFQLNEFLDKNENDKDYEPIRKLSEALIINSGKLKGLLHDTNIGIIDRETLRIATAEVQHAVLYILDQLPENVWNYKVSGNALSYKSQLIQGVELLQKEQTQFEYDIFICFSTKDREIAKPVWEILRGYGLRIFISDEDLQNTVGFSFLDKIDSALTLSQHLVLLASTNALNSVYVRDEYQAFYNDCHVRNPTNRLLIVYKLDNFQIADLPRILRNKQIASLPEQIVMTLVKENLIKGEKLQKQQEQEKSSKEQIELHDKQEEDRKAKEQVELQLKLEEQRITKEQAELMRRQEESFKLKALENIKRRNESQRIVKEKEEQESLRLQKLKQEQEEKEQVEAKLEVENAEKLETDYWKAVLKENTVYAYNRYLIKYSNGKFATEASKHADMLVSGKSKSHRNKIYIGAVLMAIIVIIVLIKVFTGTDTKQEEADAWQTALKTSSCEAYDFYISKYPANKTKAEAKKKELNCDFVIAEPEMVFVKGGEFTMGSKKGEPDEKPAHKVIVSDFYIGKYEITQKQWFDVMGNNPSYNKGCDNCPVEQVSWDDAKEFIKKLNQKTGKKYRLPTEAEWEYAARGGNQSKGFTYSGSNNFGEVAWVLGNAGVKSILVAQKNPNELGLYDMSGNVWECCSDWYDENYYKNSPENNPQGPSSGTYRVIRGGSWFDLAAYSRATGRYSVGPVIRSNFIGFRLVFTP